MVERTWVTWLWLLPLLVAGLSLAASAILLSWLSKLKGRHVRRLFSRQLWHLAAADLLEFGLITLGCIQGDLSKVFGIGAGAESEGLDWMCKFFFTNDLFGITSLLLEVHISLAAVAAVFHCAPAIRFLSRCLIFLWPIGLTLGTAVVVLDKVAWDPEVGVCNTASTKGENFQAVMRAVALGICIAAYVAGVCKTWGTSGAQARARIWDRVSWFLASSILCYAPYIVYTYGLPGSSLIDASAQALFIVVLSFLNLKGLANLLVYAWQGRYVLKMVRQAKDEHNILTIPQARGQADRQAYPVSFGEAELYTVAMVQAAAARRTERQIQKLEERALEREFGELEDGERGDSGEELARELLLGVFTTDPLIWEASLPSRGGLADADTQQPATSY